MGEGGGSLGAYEGSGDAWCASESLQHFKSACPLTNILARARRRWEGPEEMEEASTNSGQAGGDKRAQRASPSLSPSLLSPLPNDPISSPTSTLQERDRVPERDLRWTDQGPAKTGMGWEVVGGRMARGRWSSRIPRRTTWCVPSFPPPPLRFLLHAFWALGSQNGRMLGLLRGLWRWQVL